MSTLKFNIHFELPDGTEDSIVITGETISEIREAAQEAVEARHGIKAWSEAIFQ